MNTLLRGTNWLRLLAAWAICLLAGAIGAFATQSSVQTWYPTLEKPTFTPPGWLFGPVWTVLYLAMGVALYLIWQRRHRPYASGALRLFGLQLVLNAAWSVVFFWWTGHWGGVGRDWAAHVFSDLHGIGLSSGTSSGCLLAGALSGVGYLRSRAQCLHLGAQLVLLPITFGRLPF